MDTIKQSSITREIIDQAMDYEAFNKLTVELFEEGRTTNDDNSESMLNYTKLNIQRTHRIDKRGIISDETKAIFEKINTNQVWLVITEGWCGDSAQLLPYVKKMSDLNDHIELKIILRDKHPDVMDEFLTDGKSRSIPKVVILDKTSLEVLGDWGPRPEKVHQKYLAEKLDPEVGGQLASQNLHTFYARDKGNVFQNEFRVLLHTLV